MDTFEQENAPTANEPAFDNAGMADTSTITSNPLFTNSDLDLSSPDLNDPFVFEDSSVSDIFEAVEAQETPSLEETLLSGDTNSVFEPEEQVVQSMPSPTTMPAAIPTPAPTPAPTAIPTAIPTQQMPAGIVPPVMATPTIPPITQTTPAPISVPEQTETPEIETPEETVQQEVQNNRAMPPRSRSDMQLQLETHEMGMQPSTPQEVEQLTESKEETQSTETESFNPLKEAIAATGNKYKNTEGDSFADRDISENHASQQKIDYTSAAFIKGLFDNGNVCITAPDGSFPVKEDTRMLLALFSNGRFFVSETYKFDGKVLGFEYLAKKRRLQIGKPEYIPMTVLNTIYEHAAQNRVTSDEELDTSRGNEQEQARMQRDFVTIVSRAAMYHVSDIHIVVSDHTTVMFRINGLMQTEMEYNKDWGESFVRAAFASADISDSNYAQNEYQAAQKLGRTPLRGSGGKLVLPKNLLGIRLQFNPIAFGTRYVVMRLLYAEENTQSAGDLSTLGFTEREKDLFYKLRAMPTGIVVISGPTGSGKSTTLQRNMISMLQERNYEINLITVEDPPEYPIPGARQMPVTNAAVEETKDREFTKALSAALRSDPDALMIGEIRTLSAADLAFRGALSGHNVWTTLHANSAPAILMRFKDMGVEDFKLQDPEIIKGLLAQRLFRTLCPHCRIAAKDNLKHHSVTRLRKAFGDMGLEHAYLRGPGCKECDFRGVKGRIAVAELVLPDAPFLDLMMKGETQKALTYWINDLQGMTLRESAQDRMLRGLIDVEEVERWTGLLDQVVTI